MQITINTADDERGTFEARTWFDLVAPPPKPRRRPSVGAEPGRQLLQSAVPQPWRSPRKRCRYLVGSQEPSQVPGSPLAALPWKRFWMFLLSSWFTDPGRGTLGLKICRRCSAQRNKKQTVWVETRTSFAPFTWGCHVQRVKSKGWPESF